MGYASVRVGIIGMTNSRTADALALMAAHPGLSQAAAARLCGIAQSTVAHAVANQKRPRSKRAQRSTQH